MKAIFKALKSYKQVIKNAHSSECTKRENQLHDQNR